MWLLRLIAAALALLAGAACGGDRTGTPPPPASDASRPDGGRPPGTDAGRPASDAGADASVSVDAGPAVPEDCTTPGDEDGDRLADCMDLDCWAEPSCRDAELDALEITGWAPCGDARVLDDAATTEACELGGPPIFPPPETSLACGRVPIELTLQEYCEPGGSGRALRYQGVADVTGNDEMLGPMSHRSESIELELGFGRYYLEHGAGGNSSEDPYPELGPVWVGQTVHFVAWLTGITAPASVTVLLKASSWVSVITIHEDGTVDSMESDPVFFLTAGFQHGFE